MAQRREFAWTIANGASLSSTIDLGVDFAVGILYATIITPAAWTAAAITAQVSLDGNTWYNVVNSGGAEVNIISTVTAATAAAFVSTGGVGQCRYLRLRSGTGAVPVAQGAERTGYLVIAPAVM